MGVGDGKYVPERLTIATGRPPADQHRPQWMDSFLAEFPMGPQGFFFSTLRFHDTWKAADRGVWTHQCSLSLFVFAWILFRSQGPLGLSTRESVPQSNSIACAAALGQFFTKRHQTWSMPRGSQKLTATWTLKQQMPQSNVIPRSLLVDIGRCPLPKFSSCFAVHRLLTDVCPDCLFCPEPLLSNMLACHGPSNGPTRPWRYLCTVRTLDPWNGARRPCLVLALASSSQLGL